MRRRTLPTAAEAAEILGRKRTRPIRRPPPPIGKSLSKPLKALEERFGTGADGLAARWREIVGEILARRTEPVKLTKPRGGGSATLEIRVDGPAAALIQHQAPEILSRVNLFLGTGAVAKLRIVQGPVKLHASAQDRAMWDNNKNTETQNVKGWRDIAVNLRGRVTGTGQNPWRN